MIYLVGVPKLFYGEERDNYFKYGCSVFYKSVPLFDIEGNEIRKLKIFTEVDPRNSKKKVANTKISTRSNTCFHRKCYDWKTIPEYSEMVDYAKACHNNLYRRLNELCGEIHVLKKEEIGDWLIPESLIILSRS